MSDTGEPTPNDAGYEASTEQRLSDREEATPADSLPSEGLLDVVLEKTAQVSSPEEDVSEQTMERLLDVARHHRGQALQADPIARELVETILRDAFIALKQPDRVWRSMALSIAHTLMEDPHAQQRLNSFWMRLSETV